MASRAMQRLRGGARLALCGAAMFAVCTGGARAQQALLDSLQRLADTPVAHDSVRAKALIHLGNLLLARDPARGRACFEQALLVSERCGFIRGTGNSHAGIGSWFMQRGEIDSAEARFTRAAALYESIGNDNGIALAHEYLGTLRSMTGRYRDALRHYERCLEIRQRLGRTDAVSTALNNIGIVYFNQRMHARAAEYFERALRMDEARGDRRGAAIGYLNLGNVQRDIGKQLEYYRRSLAVREQLGDAEGIVLVRSMIAASLYEARDDDAARAELERLLPDAERLGNAEILGNLCWRLGDVLVRSGDLDAAIPLLGRALDIAVRSRNPRLESYTRSSIGRLYSCTPEWQLLALRHCDTAMAVARSANDGDGVKQSLASRSFILERLGRLDEALREERAAAALGDSLARASSAQQINELTAFYEADRRERDIRLLESDRAFQQSELRRQAAELARREIASMQQAQQLALLARERDVQRLEAQRTQSDLERQKERAALREREARQLAREHELQGRLLRRETLLRNAALAGIAAVLAIGWLVLRRARDRRDREARQLLTRRLLEAQERGRRHIAADLHDGLGHGLLVIKNNASIALERFPLPDIAREKLEEVAETADATLVELRHIVRELRPAQLDRYGLAATLRAMLQQAGDGAVHFTGTVDEVDGAFAQGDDINVYRIVQEAVSNIIRHSGARNATVRVLLAGGDVRIEIADDGSGFDPGALSSAAAPSSDGAPRGFGLEGMAERVRILNGRMRIDAAPGRGTRLTVTLPARRASAAV